MKFNKLFLGMLACASMVACTNEEPIDNFDNVANKDQAYVTISLYNANEASRGGDGGFVNGTADESKVNSVEFYFYNANGTYNQYVAKTGITWAEQTTGTTIEQIATNATVVLEGLKEKGKPKYVVAILNGPEKAYQNLTLAELKAALLDGVDSYVGTNGFIMSNSTYSKNNAAAEWFATEMVDANFLAEKPTKEELTSTNAVQIYVERVAVKVELGINNDNYTDGKYTLGKFEVDGVEKDITLDILGWELNAINKKSFVEKNVPAWDYNELTGWAWDDADNYRSYWAMSPNYDGGEYPQTYAYSTETENPAIADYTLRYFSWNNLKKGIGSADYCLENTNTAAELMTNNFKAKATHALLKAQISDHQDLVQYDGRLFTKDEFIKRVAGQLAVYKVAAGDAETVYTLVEPTDLEVVDIYDGNVTIGLTEAAEALEWSSTKGSVTEITPAEIETTLKDLVDAEYYKEGMMYYCIPIEHLRGGKLAYNNDLSITVEEGDYGVVRNHYYKLNIESIANLGTSVYNPDEEIVPNMETPTYYVGASINVLAWKVVNQNVAL